MNKIKYILIQIYDVYDDKLKFWFFNIHIND